MPGPVVARGERITLRTLEEADVPFRQRGCANPALRYPLGNPVRNREQFGDLDDDEGDGFVVCLDGDGASAGHPDESAVTRLGMVAVEDAHYKRPELGYWLLPECHGEGYGSEAVSLAVDYVFRNYDVPAVEAQAFAFNDASVGLLESLGFAREGRLRKFMFVDGAHRDMLQFGLLREEWLGDGRWVR